MEDEERIEVFLDFLIDTLKNNGINATPWGRYIYKERLLKKLENKGDSNEISS